MTNYHADGMRRQGVPDNMGLSFLILTPDPRLLASDSPALTQPGPPPQSLLSSIDQELEQWMASHKSLLELGLW
jgi:hypothetical protein